jgi:hypothetical protein
MTDHDRMPDDDFDPHAYYDFVDEDDEPIEAYCVSCRAKVEMLNPVAVWTSKGQPGTKGECINCGGTVYRLGRTPAHDMLPRPQAVNVVDNRGIDRKSKAARIKIEAATYIVAAATDAEFAEKLAHDLKAVGISTWTDSGETSGEVNWAGGVHPALEQCKKMVVVLSQFGLKTHSLEEAWQYFRSQRKPIVVALAEPVEPPDELRTRPRFDLYTDYKRGLRQLVEVLSS